MIELFIGYVLDSIFGEPLGALHPIRLIGKLIEITEKLLRQLKKYNLSEKSKGMLLWFIVTFVSYVVPFFILYSLNKINVLLALVVESIMILFVFATKSLKDESMKVHQALLNGDIMEARRYLSYIVGRDTENLTEEQIIKATVETISENTSDGVIAPMLFVILGGAPLGFFYKAVNTLDSMVGYKNEKYINFGRFTAKADDYINFIPSRFAAYLMIAASYILSLDYKNAFKIYKRDRYNHLSPNSAQTESVCAGALNIMLGGSNFYGGVLVHKKNIGDDSRAPEKDDIIKANNLMYVTSLLCLVFGIFILKFIR